MADIVAGQGHDRQLRKRPGIAVQAACPLENGRQIRVHVARETLASGDLAVAGGHLAQGLAVVRHVRHDDEHVPTFDECEVFRSREGKARRQQPLRARFVGTVQEHRSVTQSAAGLHGGAKALGDIMRHADADEHDGELVLGVAA